MPPPAETFASRLFLGPALRTQPDRRLVTLVREGYESAFEEIVRRYGRPLTRYAAAIVGSRGEDVTQDAFSKALLKALLAAGTMGTAEIAAAGAGAGGTVGAGVALKTVTATVLVAGAVGAGVAVQEGHHAGNRPQQPVASQSASRGETTSPTAFAPVASTGSDDRSGHDGSDDRGSGTSGSGDDRGQGRNEHGDDRGGHRGESGDDHG